MAQRVGALCFLLIAFLIGLPQAATAGSQSGGTPQFEVERIVRFAKKVEQALAEKGALVALVARMGRPESELPEGIRFTHVGFAVYSEISTSDNRKIPGYAMYNLYQNNDKPSQSSLVTDYPVDFFSAVSSLESGIVIPSPELQYRLLKLIGSTTYQQLHNPNYSAIANPFSLSTQNCTEYVLDVVNSAIYQTDNIQKIKLATKKYFKPQPVNVSPLKLMLGSMFSSEVTLSDHDGPPVTATFETISKYILQYDAGSESFVLKE